MKAGRASATARLIAIATVMRPELAPRGAAHWARQLLGEQSWTATVAGSRIGRTLGAVLERLALPGITRHWLSRKCQIDRLAREASAEGFTQLLIIGAGLDTLSFRLAGEHLYARVISADHPATLAALPPMAGAVELFPIDVSTADPLPAVSALPTLIVVEGLLMYLPEAAVKRLLGSVARLPVPRARLVASWMLETPGQPVGFREQSGFISSWLRWRGESMLWATTPAQVTDLLLSLGWHNVRIVRFALESEQLAIADAGSNDG